MIKYGIVVRKKDEGYYDVVRHKIKGIGYFKVGPIVILDELALKILELSEGADQIKLMTSDEEETKEKALSKKELGLLKQLIDFIKDDSLEVILS